MCMPRLLQRSKELGRPYQSPLFTKDNQTNWNCLQSGKPSCLGSKTNTQWEGGKMDIEKVDGTNFA